MLQVQKYFLFLCVILSFDGLCSAQHYQYEHVPNAGGWLRLHTAPATWPDALLRCILEGGVLASPSSPVMSSAMKSKMAQQHTATVFIGIHAALSEEEYVSLDGVPFKNISLTWAKGEPDNKGNSEQCLAMTGAGEVADESCSSVFRYFCYKHNHEKNTNSEKNTNLEIQHNTTTTTQQHNTTTDNCGAGDIGFKFYPRTGSCYKYHAENLSWRKAKDACDAEHARAHLAVINDKIEAQAVRELIGNEDATINLVFVNFLNTRKQQEGHTILNETLAVAGYERSRPDQPDSVYGDENCGAIAYGGGVYDVECNWKCPFICEINPEKE